MQLLRGTPARGPRPAYSHGRSRRFHADDARCWSSSTGTSWVPSRFTAEVPGERRTSAFSPGDAAEVGGALPRLDGVDAIIYDSVYAQPGDGTLRHLEVRLEI